MSLRLTSTHAMFGCREHMLPHRSIRPSAQQALITHARLNATPTDSQSPHHGNKDVAWAGTGNGPLVVCFLYVLLVLCTDDGPC